MSKKGKTRLTLKPGKLYRDGPEDYVVNEVRRDAYIGSPLDTFDKAIRSVNNDRGKNYGHPAVNFDRIARIHSVTADCPDPRARVTLGELAVKMSRLIENPYHLDSWIDIAGYARAQVMIMQREKGCPDFPNQGMPDNTGD